jgi:FKBP-type peptidyl-prolyl cis-trans isomerase
MPGTEDIVKVHYTGTTIDGTKFDSSYDRGEPAQFRVSNVIRGWVEGLQLMHEGTKMMLYVPYDLAYGERGAGNVIKPFETLIFEVELLEVIKE